MDRDAEVQRAARAMPVFPLPRTVLMPGASLPLHVFEPRYRELVRHCLDGNRLMGIATLRPGYDADYEGRPDLWPEVGIGRMVAHVPLPDGRSNILLSFVGQGRITRELPARHAFREVELTLEQPHPPQTSARYDQLRQLVSLIGGFSPQARTEAERLLGLEGSDLVDTLARKLLEHVDDRRKYLGTLAIEARSAMVEEALAEVLAAATPGAGEA